MVAGSKQLPRDGHARSDTRRTIGLRVLDEQLTTDICAREAFVRSKRNPVSGRRELFDQRPADTALRATSALRTFSSRIRVDLAIRRSISRDALAESAQDMSGRSTAPHRSSESRHRRAASSPAKPAHRRWPRLPRDLQTTRTLLQASAASVFEILLPALSAARPIQQDG